MKKEIVHGSPVKGKTGCGIDELSGGIGV